MNFPWVIRLEREAASALSSLRLAAGLEVAVTQDCLWLRGTAGGDDLDRALRALPALARFELLPRNRLRPVESRIPAGALPTLSWEPLTKWLRVELTPSSLPAATPPPADLSLIRSVVERPATVLVTSFDAWRDFVLSAPQVRLRPLRFALSGRQVVVVWGTPLPPVTGRRFVEREGIAVPAGFSWDPPVSPAVLRQVFRVGDGALVLWDENGSCVHLHPEQFVPASRSGLRATAEFLGATA